METNTIFEVGNEVKFAKTKEEYSDNNLQHSGIVVKNKGSVCMVSDNESGNTMMVQVKWLSRIHKEKFPMKLIVKEKLEPANSHLPVPLVSGEKVISTGWYGSAKQYLEIKHNRGKTKSVFSKHHFIFP